VKLRKLGRSRAVVVAPQVDAPAEAGMLSLVVHLVGRICLVEHEGAHVALFLNAQHNPALGFPKHHPVLRAAIEDSTQDGADLAKISFADPASRVQVLWDLEGHDVAFEGLASPNNPVARIDRLADIRAAYKAVDPAATWKGKAELLDPPDPRSSGIVARLALTGFDRIDSMFFDTGGELKGSEKTATLPQTRRFFPGEHSQEAHAVIRCTARFRELAVGKPTVVLTPFGGGSAKKIPFDDTSSLQMTFSNLCNCVGTDVNTAPTRVVGPDTLVMEDKEFVVYYELLAAPPPEAKRPLPFVPQQGAGSGGVVECVPAAALRI